MKNKSWNLSECWRFNRDGLSVKLGLKIQFQVLACYVGLYNFLNVFMAAGGLSGVLNVLANSVPLEMNNFCKKTCPSDAGQNRKSN